MNRFKKFSALVLAGVVAFTSMGFTGTELVKAANDEVVVKYVSDEQAFRDYIDDNAMPVADWTEDARDVGDIHPFTIEEEGTLLVAGVSKKGFARTHVYANFSLTAEIAAVGNGYVTENMASVEVKPGKYYFRAERWSGYGDDFYAYTYLGFIPKSGNVKASGKKTTTPDTANVVNVKKIDKVSELDTYIRTDGAESSVEYIKGLDSNYEDGPLHKFTVDSDGWIVAGCFDGQGYVVMDLFSTVDCSAKYMEVGSSRELNDDSLKKVYVKAGTYYYKLRRWNGHGSGAGRDVATYIGFIPTNNRIVANVTYNADKTAATVTFKYDEKYLPKYDANNFIRIEEGAVQSRHISNGKIWHTDNKENALEIPSFKVTKNGTFTARIENSKDDCYGMVVFTVSGLGKKYAKMPQNLTVKASKTTIKASALKKKSATVKLTVKGAKTALTYKLTAGNKKCASISKKGVITFKKKAKKGTYKFTVTAKETTTYKKAVKTVTIRIK